MSIDPIVKTRVVGTTPEIAFRHFTHGIGSWWPVATHSISGDQVIDVVMEPRAGGRLYERRRDGSEEDWGQVLAWEPHERVVFSFVKWHTGKPESEVEVRFHALADGRTEVRLEHRGWEVLEAASPGVRGSYDGGWDVVLGEAYAGSVEASAASA